MIKSVKAKNKKKKVHKKNSKTKKEGFPFFLWLSIQFFSFKTFQNLKKSLK
jgi:hypothetical protein